MLTLRHFLSYLMLLASGLVVAQQAADKTANVVAAAPGKDRVRRFMELSDQERERGHTRDAIEYAMMASNEAEKSGLDTELAKALMVLAKAHMAQGDIDHAIGATLRVTLVNGTYHSGLRTEALLQLAELYLEEGHPYKALEHLGEAASTTAADRMDRSRYLRTEARAKVMVLKPEAAIAYLKSQLDEVMWNPNKDLQLEFQSLLATMQARAGQDQGALASEEQVMKLAVALDRPKEAGICANNMGALYHRLGRTQDALNAYAKGLIMVEDLPYVKLNMQLNAALAYAQTGAHETAMRLLDNAQLTFDNGGSTAMKPRTLRTLSAVHMLHGDLGAAQNAALDALTAAEETSDEVEQASACDMLATILERRNEPSEAHTYERRARDIEQRHVQTLAQEKSDHEARLLRLQRIEREQLDVLNREERKEGKLKQLALDAENREKQLALALYEKQLEESARREATLAREQADRELELAHAQLETERQERKIRELDNSRMIQTLNMTKLELEKKEQQRTMEQLEKRNALVEAEQLRDREVKRMSVILAVGALFASIWLAWAWSVTRRKKRTIFIQNQQIQGINSELERKNKDIESSINYARTIQSAILPTEADLRVQLPESFMMYKPLDIVSGDLPFVKRVGDRIILAAIDCTGHGVPAAMMTFIAYYGLNDLLIRYPHVSAGVLLDQLHEHVKNTMEARGEGNLYNDGFDIGLCCLDLEHGSLSFAGAQLPLLLVRDHEVTRIKGDILPLGDAHFHRRKQYRTHEIALQRGDALYLLSDGLIHQFGGEDGRRKFSMKQLTEVLRDTAHLDLAEIKEHTERLFQEWKGDNPQTDDVLFIGLRYAA